MRLMTAHIPMIIKVNGVPKSMAINIDEEKSIVEKMKKKGNSEAEYADGMLSVLTQIAAGKSPEEIKAYVNNTLKCLECD
jgi:sulfur transfer protein SufE